MYMILLNLAASTMESDTEISISLNKQIVMLLHPSDSGPQVLQKYSYDLCCILVCIYSIEYLVYVK